jgi:hypothetical protein
MVPLEEIENAILGDLLKRRAFDGRAICAGSVEVTVRHS